MLHLIAKTVVLRFRDLGIKEYNGRPEGQSK